MKSDQQSLEAAAALLSSAQRPLLLIGPEARDALEPLLRLADRLGAAVLTTPDALSLVDGARSAGICSFGASAAAGEAAAAADVVLAASSLSEFANRLGQAFAQAEVIQLTASVSDVGRNRTPSLALLGAIETTARELERLVHGQVQQARSLWFDPLLHPLPAPPAPRAGVIHPAAAVDALERALPEAARLCLDITSASLHVSQRLKPRGSQRVFSSIERSACMGEAFMASIGIRIASGLPTLALVGDWAYLMAPAELHFPVELRLANYVVVVWANGGGALVGAGVQQQKINVSARSFRWQSPPRFARLARALHATGLRVESAPALERAVRRGLRSRRPVLIEACIDPTVEVPAGDRFLTLGEERG